MHETFEQLDLTLKRLCMWGRGGRGGHFDPHPPSCGFPKNVSSRERVKPWFFVTFNIIASCKLHLS